MQSKHQIIEAVVNISEGQNMVFLDELKNIINDPGHVYLVHRDIGRDANRTVLTIIGKVESVFAATSRLISYCEKHLAIRSQSGEHPRLGIVDVIPFIALENISHKELLERANQKLAEIGEYHRLPILYYGDLDEDNKRSLFHLRKWNLDKDLGQELKANAGPEVPHEKLGASCATVRRLMTAYNINLKTKDLEIAKKIAAELRRLRSDGQNSALDTKDVRYLGWFMAQYDCCQISTNIYDVDAVSLSGLYDYVQKIALLYEVDLNGSELIGLVSRRGISQPKESLESALAKICLGSVVEFERSERILEEVYSHLSWSN